MQRIGVVANTYLRRVRKLAELSPTESGFLAAAWVLARPVTFGLSQLGFPRVVRWLEQVPARPAPGRIGVGRGEVLVRWAFRAAAFETTTTCLPRAIVQYLLHQTFGPEPRLVVGVARSNEASPPPGLEWTLGAHAWVEERGGPPREPTFAPILTLSRAEGVVRADGR
ncbi:MAG: lasso peptide biosynthesis B2 protein [Polyangiaceae bacterium]|nr:lasso peptide biosynthesis B2 protein [Polyangiaceae bacterium]